MFTELVGQVVWVKSLGVKALVTYNFGETLEVSYSNKIIVVKKGDTVRWSRTFVQWDRKAI